MEWIPVTKKLSELEPWTRNPRQINEVQAKRLKESFDEFGQVETIAIGPDNEIYNGHQRLNVLMAENGGDFEIECRQSDKALSEKEREKLTIFLHKGAAGEWDWDILANEFEMDELIDWGFEEGELIGFEQDPPDAPEPRIDEAEELLAKWGVEDGQIWQLGEHKVICGDCTDPEVINKLINKTDGGIVLADPPYGINANKMTLGLGKKEFYRGGDWDSERSDIDFIFDISKKAIIFGGNYYADVLPITNDWLCWDKKNDNMGYSEFELIWTNLGCNSRILHHHWSGEEKKHPTQKPLPVLQWIIGFIDEELIIDPFLGSGTTLVACEGLDRTCFGVEIEPKYVAVTLERWHEMTGEKPALLSNLHA